MPTITPWNGRVAAQTDADSPVDQPLMDGIRLDLDHLREFGYGNPSGGFYTPIYGHDHDGVNSKNVTLETSTTGTNVVAADNTAQTSVGIHSRFWVARPGDIRVRLYFTQGTSTPPNGTWYVKKNGTIVTSGTTTGQQTVNISSCVKGDYIDVGLSQQTGNNNATTTNRHFAMNVPEGAHGLDYTYL